MFIIFFLVISYKNLVLLGDSIIRKVYFQELLAQCQGGLKKYGNTTDLQELQENLAMNCIPDGMKKMTADDYEELLKKRRKLMAEKIRAYLENL